ncbi:hypothetical protein JOB18_009841 [Solea senegalensis]|uniref:Uncharacterized protein n=1 Tax=Solea senegalensis TaxID=28829 RepID=A0AAV6SAA4_SOLSE|nr:hypothetical protein JOB18_009841 [Solea senegalensis]
MCRLSSNCCEYERRQNCLCPYRLVLSTQTVSQRAKCNCDSSHRDFHSSGSTVAVILTSCHCSYSTFRHPCD